MSMENPGKKEEGLGWLLFITYLNFGGKAKAAFHSAIEQKVMLPIAERTIAETKQMINEGNGQLLASNSGAELPVHNLPDVMKHMEAGNWEAAAEALEEYEMWSKGATDALNFIQKIGIFG